MPRPIAAGELNDGFDRYPGTLPKVPMELSPAAGAAVAAGVQGLRMTIRGDSIRVVHPLFQTEGGGSIPTSPLQLHVGRISVDLAIDLNAHWHSRLPVLDKSNIIRTKQLVCFGAEFANVWYACAVWTNPVARLLNDKNWLELRRFAMAPDCPVNSGSRLLRIMVNHIKQNYPNISKVMSYQDTAVHTGTIYSAAGWQAAYSGTGSSWTRPNRKRNDAQATGDKIRWEKSLPDNRTGVAHPMQAIVP